MQFDVPYNRFISKDENGALSSCVHGREESQICLCSTVCAEHSALWSLAWPHCPSFAFKVPHQPKYALVSELTMQMEWIRSKDKDNLPITDLGIKLCCPSAPHDGKAGDIHKAS